MSATCSLVFYLTLRPQNERLALARMLEILGVDPVWLVTRRPQDSADAPAAQQFSMADWEQFHKVPRNQIPPLITSDSVLMVDSGGGPLADDIVADIQSAIAPEIRGDALPASPVIELGNHAVNAMEFAGSESGLPLFCAASFKLFGYGTPNAPERMESAMLRLPSVRALQGSLADVSDDWRSSFALYF